jgi:carbamoyltransferase
MLIGFKNKEKISNLGAVAHVDGTARPQSVDKDINSKYYKVIKSFGKKTEVNVILNTSFNLKGEPIVNTTLEALNTFNKSGIDALVVGNYLINK